MNPHLNQHWNKHKNQLSTIKFNSNCNKSLYEIIPDEKDVNYRVFWECFKYQNQSFSVKDLIRANQAKNEQFVNNINLRNAIIEKEIAVNKNPNKIVSIVEKIINFNKQQKGEFIPSDLAHVAKVFDPTQLKILPPKQKLQRLPIVLTQVKAGNTSENLVNEIRQITHSLY